MKKVYRFEENQAYWDRRWSEAGEDRESFDDLSIYPIKFAEMVMRDRHARALEIGCGLGRILKHYSRQGYSVAGIERSAVAVEKLRAESTSYDVRIGDVCSLPYERGQFDVIMAFGVYHNLEDGLEKALEETARCLKSGGRFAISMRPDNLEMNLNELYWRWRNRSNAAGPRKFHKLLVGEREFEDMLAKHGMSTDSIQRARNLSLWYRFAFLRSRTSAKASEGQRRAAGYRLNAVGTALNLFTRRLMPYQTANVLVFIGRKI